VPLAWAAARTAAVVFKYEESRKKLTRRAARVFAAPGTNQTFVNTYSPLLPACDPTNYLENAQLPPEKFWNCADVTIRCEAAVDKRANSQFDMDSTHCFGVHRRRTCRQTHTFYGQHRPAHPLQPPANTLLGNGIASLEVVLMLTVF